MLWPHGLLCLQMVLLVVYSLIFAEMLKQVRWFILSLVDSFTTVMYILYDWCVGMCLYL